jgi:hypothetical protein
MTFAPESPQGRVAREFMKRKGYPDLQPTETEKVKGDFCWYFLYRLPEGVLELEVSWSRETKEWSARVVDFVLEA